MAQEFTINSSAIESKINQLLPSQGGFGAGVDFSASTMVIPIVDLTESAEGSSVREDLQTAYSHNNITNYDVTNTATTVLTTTGYYKTFGSIAMYSGSAGDDEVDLKINDGASDKSLFKIVLDVNVTNVYEITPYNFVFKLDAGDSFIVEANNGNSRILGTVRQIADVNGNLI
jgi:hypothetical protein